MKRRRWTVYCDDCGVDTTPRPKPKGRWEWYMVHDAVWRKAKAQSVHYLCVGCLEARLGRGLQPDDFANLWANLPNPWMSERLVSRLMGRQH
jgi:hypothetical protein